MIEAAEIWRKLLTAPTIFVFLIAPCKNRPVNVGYGSIGQERALQTTFLCGATVSA